MTPENADIFVRPIETFDPEDWHATERAFSESERIPLLPVSNDRVEIFQPGSIRLGWDQGKLWVLATLTDSSIFNSATQHNELMWRLGDTFEMFLKPKAQARYYEFHVTPQNLRMQLRLKSEEYIQEARDWGRGLADKDFVSEPLFEHWTRKDETDGFWEVLACVPAASVVNTGSLGVGDQWRFLFSR